MPPKHHQVRWVRGNECWMHRCRSAGTEPRTGGTPGRLQTDPTRFRPHLPLRGWFAVECFATWGFPRRGAKPWAHRDQHVVRVCTLAKFPSLRLAPGRRLLLSGSRESSRAPGVNKREYRLRAQLEGCKPSGGIHRGGPMGPKRSLASDGGDARSKALRPFGRAVREA